MKTNFFDVEVQKINFFVKCGYLLIFGLPIYMHYVLSNGLSDSYGLFLLTIEGGMFFFLIGLYGYTFRKTRIFPMERKILVIYPGGISLWKKKESYKYPAKISVDLRTGKHSHFAVTLLGENGKQTVVKRLYSQQEANAFAATLAEQLR